MFLDRCVTRAWGLEKDESIKEMSGLTDGN